jgi:hypothetical protein
MRDANEQRAKAARHKTLESVGEAANGKNEAPIPDYTVLDVDGDDLGRDDGENRRAPTPHRVKD